MRKTFVLTCLFLMYSQEIFANGGQTTVPTDLPTAVDPAHSVRSNPGALGRWKESTISFDYTSAPNEEPVTPIAMGVQFTSPLWENAGWGADFYQYLGGARDAALSFGFSNASSELGISWRFGVKPFQRDEGFDDPEDPAYDGRFGYPKILGGTRFDITFMQSFSSWLRVFFALRNVGEKGEEASSFESGLGFRPFGGGHQLHLNTRFETNRHWISSEFLYRKQSSSGFSLDLGLSMGDTAYTDDSPLLSAFCKIGFNFGPGGLYEPFATSAGGLDDSDLMTGMRVTFGQKDRPSLVTPPTKALHVNLSNISDEAPSKAFFGTSSPAFGVNIAALMHHAERSDISTLVLNIDESNLGWGQADDLRALIAHYQKKNKKVIALIRVAGPTGIYTAVAADQVLMDPAGAIMFQGIYKSIRFLAPGLQRLGIRFQTVRHAEYKSFPEIFTRGEPTPEFLEATNRNLDLVSETLISAFAQRTSIDVKGAQAILDGGPFTAESALKHGLVDQIIPLDDLDTQADNPLYKVEIEKLSVPKVALPDQWDPRDKVALVVVDGSIVRGASGGNPLVQGRNSGDISVIKALKKVAKENYSSVIIRIDSPGGDAIASESMARALKKLSDKKPVIISYGNTAASGGVMFASGAKVPIIASPLTITGSIGVFAMKVIYRELTDDLSLPLTALGRGKRAGIFSPDRPWNEEEQKALETMIGSVYQRFVRSVAKARGQKPELLEPNCRGRVWMGKDALSKDLVDSIGGLPEALEQARILGGFETHKDYVLEYIPIRNDFFQNLLATEKAPANSLAVIQNIARTMGIETLAWALQSPPGTALARMPTFNDGIRP